MASELTQQEAIELVRDKFGAGTYALEKANRFPRYVIEDWRGCVIGQGLSYESAIANAEQYIEMKSEAPHA